MGEKILLVDDEPGIRKVLGITLADAGYEVLTAESAAEALEKFRAASPAIVLTDIKMPGEDGIELLRQIKQENKNTEVIMMTGHGDMDLAIKSLKHEATDFVTKPINGDVLDIALQRARERIQMRREIQNYTNHLEDLVREKSEQLIKAERLAAVGQVIEGLTSAQRGLVDDLEGEISFFNEMPCFVSIHSRDLKILAANQLFVNRLGERIGGGSWEVYKGPAANPHLCPVSRTFEDGRGRRSKEVIMGGNGADLPVIVHTLPIRNSDGDVDLVMEISADISEVRRLQEELWDTQAKYHQLFEAAPCFITILDRDYRIQAANRLFKKDFGSQVGNLCYKVYRNQDEPCVGCPVTATFEDGELHQAEIVASSPSGKQYNFLINTASIWDANDEIVQVMEMATDITQIRQLQTHLSNLGLLISSISHSIKGLLTGLDGGMYLVESGYRKEDRKQIFEGWETVQLMVGRIRSMVLDILYYAKERNLEWERVSVAGFVEDVTNIIRPKARRNGVRLNTDFDRNIVEIEADPTVCRSALVNILENAIEACLDAPSDRKREVTFRTRQNNGDVIFEISDNGAGMDTCALENLFTPFYSSKGHLGTGLGLFISNKVIQQHGGRIDVDSRTGEGTVFKIHLPKFPPLEIKNPEAGPLDSAETED